MKNQVWSLLIIIFSLGFGSDAKSFWWWGDSDKPDVFRSQSHKDLYKFLLIYEELEEEEILSESLEVENLPVELTELPDKEFLVLAERLKHFRDLNKDIVPSKEKKRIEAVTEALRSFQERHAIEASGTLDEASLAELNRPLKFRVAQIKAALDSWKELPEKLGKRYILVNVPEFMLRAYDGADEVLESRVIVGKEYKSETPSFSQKMEIVIFRPFWNIPHSIVKEEIAEKAESNPEYLERNDFEIVEKFGLEAEALDNSDENIAKLGTGELNLRQRSGPGNSLGLVKFLFPNKHAVYLHDTPARHLFQKEKRDFSHGCVRVEKPADLASYLLSPGDKSWTAARAKEAMNTDEYQGIVVKKAPMVHITYLPATVSQDQKLYFHSDIYKKIDVLQAGVDQGVDSLTASNE